MIKIEHKPPIHLRDIFGMFETVSAVPTGQPNKAIDQIKIYVSGATLRLYIYDINNNTWRYAGLT